MKNIISYSRVSTDEQAQQGYSLDYQEQTIAKYCELKGYKISASFKEDYSAKDFNRPEWLKLLQIIRSKSKNPNTKISSIVFLRPDRFSRNLLLSLIEKEKLGVLGCTVEYVEGNVDTSSPESLIIEAINYALPQVENEKLSLRTKEGSYRCRTFGGWTGSPLRGYKCVRLDKYPTMEFDEKAPIIKESFEKMASGLYSADEIRRWVNSKGINITKNQFPNIIRNIAYTGKIHLHPFKDNPERIIDGLHPALVSDELFHAANEVLEGRKRNMNFKTDDADLYPLKGFLKCPKHGRTLSAYKSKGRSNYYHYYVCTKNRCQRFPLEWSHKQIEKILSRIQVSSKILNVYKAVLEDKFEKLDAGRKSNIKHLEKEIHRLNNRKNFLQEEYMDGKITSVEYQELKANNESQLFRTKSELDNLENQSVPFKSYLLNDITLLEDIVGFYRNADGKTKKKLLSKVFGSKVVFDKNDKPKYTFTPPIKSLLKLSEEVSKYGTLSSSSIKTFAHNSSDIKLVLEGEKLQKRS